MAWWTVDVGRGILWTNNTLSQPRLGPSSNGKHAVLRKDVLLSMAYSGMS
ncbi:hypothetical protein ACHAWU_008864 [Discostella pseudostelligera]|uniref:Uncharacterized protein n=1 Tax=Discostella pseudostelligera TaxID=259834 RepID=A0ABD3N9T9_9STRA